MNSRYLLILLIWVALLFNPIPVQTQTNIHPLSVGLPIERELKGDEAHLYNIAVTSGQYLHIVIEQRGIDVVVTFFGADGKKLTEVDSPNGTQGPEPLFFFIEASGNYRLEVRSLEKSAPVGHYVVRIEELRTATEKDKTQILAQQALTEAELLNTEQAVESIQKAINKYEEALLLFRLISDSVGEGVSLSKIGTCYTKLGNKQKALEYYNQALPIYNEAKDKNSKASILTNIGEVYNDLGDKQKSLEYYNQALPLFRETGEKNGEATTLNNIGSVFSDLGDKKGALEYFNQALFLRRAVGDKVGEALTLNNIGTVYDDKGDRQKALDYYNQALELSRAVGDKSGEATYLTNIGAVYFKLGNKQKALEFYNQALPFFNELGDKSNEAITLINIGSAHQELGEKKIALDYYKKALPLLRETEDKSGEGTNLNNIGAVFSDLGEIQQALDYYDQALKLFRETEDKSGEAQTLSNIGLIQKTLGKIQQALNYFEQALSIHISIEDKSGEATDLTNIGSIYDDKNEKQKALEFYNRALPIRRDVGDRNGEAITLSNIGKIYNDLGDKQKAINYYNQALLLHKSVGNKSGEAKTLSNMMFVWRAINDRFAVFYGKQSINSFQKIRSINQELDKEILKTYLKSIQVFYQRLSSMLIEQGRLEEAHQILNSFKDQQYMDFYPETPLPIAMTQHETVLSSLYEAISDRAGKVENQLAELRRNLRNQKPSNEDIKQIQQLETQYKNALGEFSAIFQQAENDFRQPLSDKDKVAGILDTKEMQTALRNLQSQTGQETVAIYTLEGENNYYVLLITKDKIATVSYSIKSTDLRQKAIKFFGQLSEVNKQTNFPKFSKSEVQKTGKELYNIVFAPVAAKLRELNLKPDVLMWSLDGGLRYLPVAALYDGKKYLAKRYRNVIFTRANSDRMLVPVSLIWTGSGFYNSKEYSLPVRNPDDGKMKLVGFDGLKNAKTEVETIFGIPPQRGIISGNFLSDEQFTKESLFTELKLNRPLVHIASHFKFEAGDASKSFLLLGDGNKLTLEDIKTAPEDLFKGMELLTLSACETGVQKERESDGREIDSFAELAQRKGVKAVLASLWRVDDESTSQLMTQFYRIRQTQKLTKAEALQRAQLSLLKSKDFSHPYYWSPFILIGNWR